MEGARQMRHFTSGVIAGGIIAAIGVGMIMSDSKTRRKIARGHRNAMRKTENLIDEVTDMF